MRCKSMRYRAGNFIITSEELLLCNFTQISVCEPVVWSKDDDEFMKQVVLCVQYRWKIFSAVAKLRIAT